MSQLLNLNHAPLSIPYSSFFIPNFPIRTRKSSNLYQFRTIPFDFSRCATKNLHILAQFRRLTKRRNSLRKKLVDDQQVCQNNPSSFNPSSDFQSSNLYVHSDNNTQEILDSNSLKESNSSDGWKTESKRVGESAMSSKLEKWVDQYNKDVAYWGIGSAHIFTIFHDLEGNVKRVLVDENEIIKRSQVGKHESWDRHEVDSKILYAKSLARELERGDSVIPRNSSVAKFVVSGENNFINSIRGVPLKPDFVPVVLGFGKIAFCGFVALWAMKKLFTFGNKEQQLTALEKEMVRRKIKSRKEEKDVKGEVEVVHKPSEPPMPTEKPKLDKEVLMRSILEAKAGKDKFLLESSSSSQTRTGMDFQKKIVKIRAMAREARQIELGEQPVVDKDKEEKQPVNEELSRQMEMVGEHTGKVASYAEDITNGESDHRGNMNGNQGGISIDRPKVNDIGYLDEMSIHNGKAIQYSESSRLEVSKDMQTAATGEVNFSSENSDGELHMPNGSSSMAIGEVKISSENPDVELQLSNGSSGTAIGEVKFPSENPDGEAYMPNGSSSTTRPRIIRSVREAKEFLSKKGKKKCSPEPKVDIKQESIVELSPHTDKTFGGKTSQIKEIDRQGTEPVALGRISDPLPASSTCEDLIPEVKGFVPTTDDNLNSSEERFELKDLQDMQGGDVSISTERRQSVETDNWMEKNFHEVEPIIKKIGEGIRDNYKLAREKVNQLSDFEIKNLDYNYDDNELQWMKDDNLREIVFQVQENELSGRDPFYLMDAEDKLKFFRGLEKKVEEENEKLLKVHEYLHSNIENLDYGADGISLYDQPEKFIPRWKGHPLEKNPEFLNNFQRQRTGTAGNVGTAYLAEDKQNLTQKLTESRANGHAAPSLSDNALKKNLCKQNDKDSKTIIEGSDGSVRPGKKSGKEYWQHTKKWSHGFLESYNAETDPEIKSVMRDMGKDLDRWITEEEIQEAADLMKKLPERNKKFIEKKMNKLRREMELFGPQAVVSKYREYAEEKEEDYLWWLDLPHILCIELYTTQNGEQKIGFYSLEMAADLELEPKPCHVIAFENAGNCKNFCYIIQAHMDMLGCGHAFVVPRPPKNAFRDAKASGFGVTVIRKGELQLNIDQTLEEVEEQIMEIGSKMYHDELMRERSVDISALMKGVFGFKTPTASITTSRRKRSKRTLKKPRENSR